MSNLKLYHYFSNPLAPFQSYTDEDLSSPEAYAAYAASVKGFRMQGYDADYFKKRMEREAFFRSIIERRFGPNIRRFPIYMTLGSEDARFFLMRRHRFSVSMSVCIDEKLPVLFCVGDSMSGTLQNAIERTFFYPDLVKLSCLQIMKLFPEKDCDRYIEAQVWDDSIVQRLLPPPESPVYLAKLSKCMVSACFGDELAKSTKSLMEIKTELQKDHLFEPFCRLAENADVSLIPSGRIHGIPHSFRCAFLAFSMALDEGVSLESALWAAKCAAYHDAGRIFGNDASHAEMVSLVTDRLFPCDQVDAAVRVMRCHCEDSAFISGCFEETEKELQHLAVIVHDADCLDYIRFAPTDGLSSFNPCCLIGPNAAKFVQAALEFVLFSLNETNWIDRFLH